MSLEERKKETFCRVLEEAGCRRRSEDPLGSYGAGSLQFLSADGQIGVGGYDVQDCIQLVNIIEEKCCGDEDVREAFVQGMKLEFGDAEGLLGGVSPAMIVGAGYHCTDTGSPGCWESVAGDSLIRLLMLAKPVRKELAVFLIERVPELEKESGKLHLAVLGQFRWLEVNSGLETRDIIKKMVEIMPTVGYDSQKQIAVVLSEIVGVESQEVVVDALYHVCLKNQEFLNPMLECVSAMNLSRDQMLKFDDYLFGLLTDVLVDKVPLIFEHLLFAYASASCEDLERRLQAIKREISFGFRTKSGIQIGDVSAHEQVEHENVGRSIFGVLCHGMPCRADLCRKMIKYLNSLVSSGESLATLDFWISLNIPCHLWGGRHHKIKFYKDVLRSKKSCEIFREGIQGHVNTIHEKLDVLSDVAFHLIKQKNSLYRECGVELLGLLLGEFSEAALWDYVKHMLQQIFESLSAPLRDEWCAALQACTNLVNQPKILSKVCENLTLGLLECIVLLKDSPEIDQALIRRKAILDVVLDCGAAASKSLESIDMQAKIESSILSFLESQLMSWNVDSQVLGSTGVVRLIVKLGKFDEGTEKGVLFEKAKLLLLTGLESQAKKPELFAIICDAISSEADYIPQNLQNYIVQKISDELETGFIVQIDQIGKGCWNKGASDLQIVPWWNLNGEMRDVLLPLTPYDMSTFRRLWSLFPLLKLICKLNWSLHADLSQIDALLGLQIGLPSKNLAPATEFQCLTEEDQKKYLMSLFLALGWFRELLSGFGRAIEVGLSNESHTFSKLMGVMLCSRLSEALQLEAVLQDILSLSSSKFNVATLLSKGSALRSRARKMVGGKRKRSKISLKENTESLNSQGQAGERSKKYGCNGYIAEDMRQEVHFPSLLSLQDMSNLRPVSPCSCTSFFGMFTKNKLPILFSTIPSAYYVSRELVSILETEDKIGMKQRISLMNQFAKFVTTVRRLMEKAIDILLFSELQEDDMLKQDMENIAKLIPEEALASMPEYLDRINSSSVARSCTSPRNCAIPLLDLLSLLLLKSFKAYKILFDGEEFLRQILGPFSSGDTQLQALLDGAFKWLTNLDSTWMTVTSSKIAFSLTSSVQSLWLSFRCRTVKILCILLELRLQFDPQDSGKDSNVSCMESQISSIVESLLQMQGPFMPESWPIDLGEELGDLVAILSRGIGKSIPVNDGTNNAMLTLRPVHFTNIGKIEYHDQYKSLTSTTLDIWHKSNWRVLINKWTSLMQSISRSKNVSESHWGLEGFNECCRALHLTVSIVKVHSSNDRILIESIKSSILFLDQLVKAVPSIPHRLLASKESLRSIKEVQKSIRVLHSVCAQAKIKADMQLTNCIPKFKKCAERFVIEMVKLLKNEALEVELGELKHRDLQGNALQSSQLFPSLA